MAEGDKTYTKEDLAAMDPVSANNLMMLATKIEGTVVVKRADGSIRYDDDAIPGTYGEEFLSPPSLEV